MGAVASLYANPDYRISSDIDVLIAKKNEKKIIVFLQSKRYDIKKRRQNEHCITAIHAVGGFLEVYISLNNELFDKFTFNLEYDYTEPKEKFSVGGRDFYILVINDNLLFLTGHCIRRFIGGSSIRQMMDLLLYIKQYDDQIDFDRYNKILAVLNYDKLIQAVNFVGTKYFGINFEATDESYINILLSDCEIRGILGPANKHTTNVSNRF